MVVSSDFQKSFSEIDLHEILGENIDSEEAEEDKCEISEIKWSGEDGVVVSFGNRVILAGPFGGTLE
ncbi:hypothetical protein AX774_g2186 [Zancudomyces culisetae]|uniref:Uncharacterized protein n=1 Tax=Zancudomyces culisetae TaxID=1213189 RepID=A0A1R1PTQ8_ZANCU|nr:hypothetical protein AX774_g2186 [Zancudomyces culisetae]|eukprot:OMH84293.1 hypothetical protein AX774_g2186 [Zancudomyces culisetae]